MTQTAETPEPPERVHDATPDNWVDLYAPDWARPYLRLSRADRPIGTWLLLLPCWWGVLLGAAATGWTRFDLWLLVATTIGAVLMRGAGCTWNDYSDRDIDAQVARTRSRPIPSGQVTPQQALIWMAVQALVAFAILLTFNRTAIFLGIASLALVALYPFAKRVTYWPQLVLGLTFNWGVLLGWSAHTGSLGLPALLVYAAGVVWTLFYDTIYAHQDTEDDALLGVKSTALLFGDATKRWLQLFMMACVVLMSAGVIMALLSRAPLPAMLAGVGGAWAMGWHMAWQIARLKTYDPATCLALFRANRDAGLIMVVALVFANLLMG